MEHADSAIESELLDLGGVPLEQLRATNSRERVADKQRLLRKLDQPDVNFGGDEPS